MAWGPKGVPKPKWPTGPKCDGCPYREKSFGFATPDGVKLIIEHDNLKGWDMSSVTADAWLIGEAAASAEVASGLPFQGAAGHELGQMLYESHCNMTRRDFYITNVCKCRTVKWRGDKPYISPSTKDHVNKPPSPAQQRECYNRYLREELSHFKGKLIVTMGAIALQQVCQEKPVSFWRGTITKSAQHNHKVMPTYHPAAIFQKYGLRRVTIRDLARIPVYMVGNVEEVGSKIILYGKPSDLDKLENCKMPAVDIETVRYGGALRVDGKEGALNPDNGNIGIVGFANEDDFAVVFRYTPQVREAIDKYISSRPKLLNQNLYGFDAHWFWKKGIPTTNILYDTMVEHYIANPEGEHGLYSVQSEYADHPEPNWKSKKMYKENIELVNGKDVVQTMRAHKGLEKYLRYEGQWELYEDHVLPLQWVLLQLRLRGVRVNQEGMFKYHLAMQKQLQKEAALLRAVVGPTFNWKSSKQMCELLYDRMNLPVRYNKDGNRTSEAAALEALYEANPESKMLHLIMKLRKINHLDSHYFRYGLDELQRVYPQIMCHVAANGRLACKDPTIHNVPEGIARQVFEPDEGKVFITSDYSQIEFMTWLWYGAEWDLLRSGWEGYDFHSMVAALFFGLDYNEVSKDVRHKAKFIDFGLIYGRGAPSIAKANNIPVKEVEGLVEKFAAKLPGAWHVRKQWVKDCRELGYNETVFHRRRYMRPRDATKVYNFKPAGTAADITARTLRRIFYELDGERVQLTPLTVHDSFTVQCRPNDARWVVKEIQAIATTPVPEMPAASAGMPDGARFRVETKIGYNWNNYHEKTNPKGLKGADVWLKENGL